MGTPVVCFIPCCKKKGEFEQAVDRPHEWTPSELQEVWAKLETARRGMEHCIDSGSSPTPALHLYTGHFYSVPHLKEAAERLIRSGALRLFIISAGYGILDAWEPARKYEVKMEKEVARYWRSQGLVDIVAEVCLKLRPSQVYGFSPGTASWSGAGAKYRYFFTDGLRRALKDGLKPQRAGCFYRAEGRGVSKILRALGECFHDFASTGFKEDYPGKAVAGELVYHGIQVGYEEIGAASLLNV